MRRILRISVKTFLLLVALYAVGRLVTVSLGSFYHGDRAPYLQMPAPNAMTVRWQTAQKTSGKIHYGLVPRQLNDSVLSPFGQEHEVRLSGLKPDTRYYYRIESEQGTLYSGQDYWFHTPPANDRATSSRFLVLGDPGYAGARQIQVRDTALAWLQQHPRQGIPPLDFIATTGDNAYRSGSNKQFQAGFFQPYQQWLRNYPIWPAYGNHDARRWAFFNLFTFPQYGESGGLTSHTQHYYSFDSGLLHVVMLDSQSSSMRKGSAMLRWLRSDLRQTNLPWIVVILHHPPYTRGSHDSDDRRDSWGRMFRVRENVLPILEQSGVDLVLSGHSHVYERSHIMGCHYGISTEFNASMQRKPINVNGVDQYTKPQQRKANSGTVYTVLGSSSKLDHGPLDHPANAISLRKAGSLLIDMTRQKLLAYFIDDEGIERDVFSIKKTANNALRFSCKN